MLMFVAVRIALVISMITLSSVKVLCSEDVGMANALALLQPLNLSAAEEAAKQSAEHMYDVALMVESNCEGIVCGIALLVILALNQLHIRFEKRSSDKLGGHAKGSAPFVEPKRKAPLGAPRRKLRKEKVISLDETKQQEKEKDRMRELLNQHAHESDVDELTKTLEEMEERFGGLLMTDYSLVITYNGRAGNADIARNVLHRALDAGHTPGLATFNAVIHSYSKQGQMQQALSIADHMKRMGLEFDTITYNTLIDAWARVGNAAMAQLWMTRMLKSGVKASVVSFCSVLRACAQAGLLDEVEEWFVLSQKLGIQLNLICFTSVVTEFAKKEDVVNAMKWMARMAEQGVEPNVQCYMGVLTSILKQGDMDLAATVLERMRTSGVQPDGGIYSQCIMAAASDGHRKLAQNWADECVAHNYKLTRAAEQAMIKARLRVPNFKKQKKAANIENESSGKASSKRQDETTQAVRVQDAEDEEQRQTARMACVGHRFTGVIKDFNANKFGYIICDETYPLFHRDVFLAYEDNPEMLAKGQRVTFTLRIDHRGGLPRACDLRVCKPSC